MWQHDWGKWTSTPIDPGISVYRNPLNETQLVAVGRSVSVSLHLSLGVSVSLCLYNPMSRCLGVSVSLPLLLSFVLGLKMDAPTPHFYHHFHTKGRRRCGGAAGGMQGTTSAAAGKIWVLK